MQWSCKVDKNGVSRRVCENRLLSTTTPGWDRNWKVSFHVTWYGFMLVQSPCLESHSFRPSISVSLGRKGEKLSQETATTGTPEAGVRTMDSLSQNRWLWRSPSCFVVVFFFLCKCRKVLVLPWWEREGRRSKSFQHTFQTTPSKSPYTLVCVWSRLPLSARAGAYKKGLGRHDRGEPWLLLTPLCSWACL